MAAPTFAAGAGASAAALTQLAQGAYCDVYSQYALASTGTGAKTASVTVGYLAIAAATYPTRLRIWAAVSGSMAAGGDWQIKLGWDIAADPTDASTSAPAISLMSHYLNNATASAQKMTATLAASRELAASTDCWVRVFAERTGGTFTLEDPYGVTLLVERVRA